MPVVRIETQPTPRLDARDPASAESVDALRSELAHLSAELDLLRERQAAATTAAPVFRVEPGHEALDEERVTLAFEREQENLRQQALDTLDEQEDAFARTPIDSQASIRVESELAAALESGFEGAELETADCAADVCRLELSFANEFVLDKTLGSSRS